jgi:acetyl-CoA C-acetyltransferase
VGIYSATPRAWTGFSSAALQAEVDGWTAPALADPVPGRGTIETYTIDYSAPEPRGLVIGRDAEGLRFVAMTGKESPLVQALIAQEPLAGEVAYSPDEKGRLVVTRFSPQAPV